MDLIDRQELMKKIRCRKNGDCEHCDFFTDGDSWCDGEIFGTTIMQMPTYKPTRSELRRMAIQNEVFPVKRGEWVEYGQYDAASGRCSRCGWEAHKYEDDVVGMPYCPNCGADMRGEEE